MGKDLEPQPLPIYRAGNLLLALYGIGVLALVGCFVVFVGYVVMELNRSETLPMQTSPDGTVSIEFTGKRTIFGSVEVVATTYDRNRGGRRGPYVKDLLGSFEEFREKYGEIDFRDEGVYARGDQVYSYAPQSGGTGKGTNAGKPVLPTNSPPAEDSGD